MSYSLATVSILKSYRPNSTDFTGDLSLSYSLGGLILLESRLNFSSCISSQSSQFLSLSYWFCLILISSSYFVSLCFLSSSSQLLRMPSLLREFFSQVQSYFTLDVLIVDLFCQCCYLSRSSRSFYRIVSPFISSYLFSYRIFDYRFFDLSSSLRTLYLEVQSYF